MAPNMSLSRAKCSKFREAYHRNHHHHHHHHSHHHNNHHHPPPATMSSALNLGPEYYEETPRRYFTLGVLCCCISGFVFFIGIIFMVRCSKLLPTCSNSLSSLHRRCLARLPPSPKRSTSQVSCFSYLAVFCSSWASPRSECTTRARISAGMRSSSSTPRTCTPAAWSAPRAGACTRPTFTSSTRNIHPHCFISLHTHTHSCFRNIRQLFDI